MTRRHRRPAMSAINVARLAFAGAIIGGGSLALAGQASASTGGEWDQLAHSAPPHTSALDVPLAPAPDDPPVPPAPPDTPPPGPAPAAGGPPPVPEVPIDQQVHGPGQLGYLRQIWHDFHDHPEDVMGGVMPGDDSDAPPGAPTGSQQVLPPGTPPLPPGEVPLPPDQQPHPLHAGPPPS
jgi:hypothetical protein